jgi:hypothetical protein
LSAASSANAALNGGGQQRPASGQNGQLEMGITGQKAVIAIGEDSVSGVIKYHSEQDVVSICE